MRGFEQNFLDPSNVHARIFTAISRNAQSIQKFFLLFLQVLHQNETTATCQDPKKIFSLKINSPYSTVYTAKEKSWRWSQSCIILPSPWSRNRVPIKMMQSHSWGQSHFLIFTVYTAVEKRQRRCRSRIICLPGEGAGFLGPHHFDATPDPALVRQNDAALGTALTPFPWLIWCKIQKKYEYWWGSGSKSSKRNNETSCSSGPAPAPSSQNCL
jgi:hypothetical protein